MKIKKFFLRTAALFFALLAVSTALPVSYADSTLPDTDGARVVYMYNIDYGITLISRGTEDRIFPASTVKIMSGLVAVTALSGRLDETVTVRDEMRKGVVGFDFSLREGDELTVRDLLYLAFCGSYHDALAIIEHLVAGGDAEFVAMMNERAAELGMTDTYYTNATGIADEKMYSTGADIAKLALEASRSKLYMTITSAPDYTPEGLKNYTDPSFFNRNYLVGKGRVKDYYNPLCRGMSAGSTAGGSEYYVVTVAQKEGVSYLCMVLGAPAADNGSLLAYTLTNDLIAWAFASYGAVTLLSRSEIMGELPVSLALDTGSVLIVPAEDVTAFDVLTLAGNNDRVRISSKFTVSSLTAPVTAGTRVGSVTVLIDGEEYRTVALVTKSGVARSKLEYFFFRIKSFARSRFFFATMISLAVYTVIYLIIRSVTKKEKKRSERLLK